MPPTRNGRSSWAITAPSKRFRGRLQLPPAAPPPSPASTGSYSSSSDGVTDEDESCLFCAHPCSSCYWVHSKDEGKSFLKFFANTIEDRMLGTAEFAREFRGTVFELVVLECASGARFSLTTETDGSTTIFGEEDWEAFSCAQDLREGDYGVFTYQGPSKFRVLLFDSNGNEKFPSYVSKTDSTQTGSRNQELRMVLHGEYYSAKNVDMMPALRDHIENLLDEHHGDIPAYVCTMTPTNVRRGCLNFSRDYTARHLLGFEGPVRMIPVGRGPGRSGRIKIGADRIARIAGGWGGFVQDNKINIGDTCLFTMTKHVAEEYVTILVRKM